MLQSLQSETGKIKNILLKTPQSAFVNQEKVNEEWQKLNYTACPNMEAAQEEYGHFLEALQSVGIEVHFLPENRELSIDSIYCRDASIMSNNGAILCRMGKVARRGESDALGKFYEQIGLPILGRIEGTGKMEGGDALWIDENTLAVGRGYRTNAEGIRQLKEMAQNRFEVIEVHLPHFRGEDDVFHLMSVISPIDKDLALVYSPLMPVAFRELLLEKGIQLVEVPEQEFDSLGGNVLALGARQCLMAEGNPITEQRLKDAGANVLTYKGTEISLKGCGGPTCLTRPIWRSVD
ncbi:MAG: dimethylarginine dimethylaminohydrolase family protein [Chitinophagales bacterium]